MNNFTESNYEEYLINEKFKYKFNYQYKNSSEVEELRGSLEDVLLLSVIEESVIKINKGISKENVHEVMGKINSILGTSSLSKANQEFHKLLVSGVKVQDQKENRSITFNLVDFKNPKNNSFILTNQFKMKSNHYGDYKNQIPDMVLYINGIPMVVFELKGMEESTNIDKAYNQIRNYETFLVDLFKFNAFNIISDGANSKFGAIGAALSRYKYWKGSEYSSESNIIFDDLFEIETLLDVIKNFTFFNEDGTKIIASNHQYYGVKKSLDKAIKVMNQPLEERDGKIGIFWHTQGSGKSFSMMFLVNEIAKVKPGTTFVVVTDRNDLDNQLYKTFNTSKGIIKQKVHQIKSINDLKDSLKDLKQDGVYFTTVQKFTKDVGELSGRNDILIISDEAHRSHNNIEKRIEVDVKKHEIIEKEGSAIYLRSAFPNASFIGFTGTPVKNDDVSTVKIFGEYIDQYLMSDAERDGVVVPIRYESRKPELRFNEEEMKILVDEHNNIINEIRQESDLAGELVKKINKTTKKLKNFIGDPQRIEGIVNDFIHHYETREDIVEGKAMFVAFDRFIAFNYYKEIIVQRPEWKNKVALIMTTNQQSDPKELLEIAKGSEHRRKMAIEFKKNDSKIKIAIVVDMWLTGFDVPSIDMIYIDKPIKMHNLMQTIARTNRVYSNKKSKKNKEYGLVIDYIGLWSKLVEALAFYSGKEEHEVISERDIKSLREKHLKRLIKNCKDFELYDLINYKVNYKLGSNEQFKLMNKLIQKIYRKNRIDNNHMIKQQFISATKDVSKHFNEVASVLSEEEKFFFMIVKVVRQQIIKRELGEFDLSDKNNKLVQQLEKTIEFKGTDVIAEVESNPIFLSKILEKLMQPNDEEMEELDINLKASLMSKMIDYSKKKNFIMAQDLQRNLKELMDKYDRNFITMQELMEKFKEINKVIEKLSSNERDELGYTPQERAFYNMVAKPVENLSDFDTLKIKLITNAVLDKINSIETIKEENWTSHKHLIKKLRGLIRMEMIKNNYPPVESDGTADEMIKQIIKQKESQD